MKRVLVQIVSWCHLDDLPEIHDGDPRRDVANHREVVGDEEVGEAELVLELLEQVDDLRLNRDVERRHRLVADEKLGVQRERTSEPDALALPTGELVRVPVRRILGQADRRQELVNARIRLALATRRRGRAGARRRSCRSSGAG